MSHAAEPSGFDESDLQASQTAGYRPPAQKTLAEINQLDQDDEAMQKYKAALLGNAGSSADAGGKPTVRTSLPTNALQGRCCG
jgi:Rho GDP-dissociation inhibitor